MTRQAHKGIAIAGLVALVALIMVRERIVFFMPEPTIERYLARKTPLGSAETDILTWLHGRGVPAQLSRVHIEPSPPNDYPLTKIGGEAFIHESIAHYSIVFRTDIEVFYIFNGAGKLVDLRVRKSVDSL